jgi:hypothetical protein
MLITPRAQYVLESVMIVKYGIDKSIHERDIGFKSKQGHTQALLMGRIHVCQSSVTYRINEV